MITLFQYVNSERLLNRSSFALGNSVIARRHFGWLLAYPIKTAICLPAPSVRASLLLILMASLLAAFTGAHAAGLRGDSYVTLAVPDLRQAVTFFRNILDCELAEAIDSTDQRPQHALLLCESDMVVELFASHGKPVPVSARNTPVQFFANDVGHADQWLRRKGVKVVGAPVMPSSGPQAGMILVNFEAPWGQPLQLVGQGDVHVTAVP